jgi:protocatechuate 3,4-dioxygenase, beta subunit
MKRIKARAADRRRLNRPLPFIMAACIAWGFVVLSCGAQPKSAATDSYGAQAGSDCEGCGAAEAPANLSWATEIAPAGEPGERLVMSGTVYEPDGVTPARDILLYVYHTNSSGVYPKNTPNNGRNSWRHGYLRGWMRTGADGRYEFRTIKPEPYPNATEPAHIHVTLSGPGLPEYYIASYIFEGDRFITDALRSKLRAEGELPSIISLKREANGLLRGSRNITLRRK